MQYSTAQTRGQILIKFSMWAYFGGNSGGFFFLFSQNLMVFSVRES